jgi:hypothetical protein
MNISPDLRRMYDALSTYNIEFLEHVKKNPEFLKRSQFSQLFEWDDPSLDVTMQPWPLFISRQARNMFEEVVVKILELIKSIPRRLFSNDPLKLSAYYNLPVDYVKMCLYGIDDEFIENMVARGDFIFTPSGLKCLEYNVSVSLGGWEQPIWESLLLQVPIISEFMKSCKAKITRNRLISHLFEHLTRITRKCIPDEDEINIAIAIRHQEKLKSMFSMEEPLNQLYKESMLKGKVILCNFDQLYVNGEYAFYEDKRIHLILDFYSGEIPLEFLILFKMIRVSGVYEKFS